MKFIELARLTSSAFLFSLAKKHVLEEQGKEDAHHQAISDQRRDDVRKELKERLGDNGDHRPHEDWNPYGEILSSFDRPLSRQHHINTHQELRGESNEENGTNHRRGDGGKNGP